MEGKIGKVIGQTWACPGFWSVSGDEHGRQTEYGGYVAVKSNVGWLVLVNIIQHEDGSISHDPVKPDSLPVVK